MHVLDVRESTVKCVDIPGGQQMYICYADAYMFPVGFVWGCGDSRGVFEGAGSYVEPWARRQGVRTKINEAILRDYPVIRTNYGSEDGGMKFMRKQGYRFSKDLHCYFLHRPKKRTI